MLFRFKINLGMTGDLFVQRFFFLKSTLNAVCVFNSSNQFFCSVRAPLDKFLQLPFRVVKFKLARIHPMKLKVHIYNETAELV